MPMIPEDSTPQQVFDFVAAHMIRQGSPSMRNVPTKCAYRGGEGRTCAVGCLMTDGEYQLDYEGEGLSNLIDYLPPFYFRNYELLLDLQSVHDNKHSLYWSQALAKVAHNHNLTYTQQLPQHHYHTTTSPYSALDSL